MLKSCILLLKTLEVYLFSLNNRTEILVYIIAQRSGKMMFQISITPCTHISFLLLWSQVHNMSHFQIEPSHKNNHTLGSMLKGALTSGFRKASQAASLKQSQVIVHTQSVYTLFHKDTLLTSPPLGSSVYTT